VKLIVGLGNPGPEYLGTRHNVGFEALDRVARRHAPGAVARAKFSGAMIEADIEGERALLLKPLTYMNRSGQPVADAARFFKIDTTSDLLIIVDDVALECGTIRLRPEGSAGGHNGLADVEMKLGTSQYCRLRIGIDGPGQIPQKEYVLGRFRPDQLSRLEPALDAAADAAVCWALTGITESMNRFNRKAIA
jgi:PTH1 family peptidyl-tRNA hydrolase